MKGDALLFMLFSWGLVICLTTYCFSKLFSSQGRKRTGPPGKKDKKTAR